MNRTRLFRNVHLGIKSLLLHKLRSMLTVLGVVFGVGSVVAMLSIGEGASQKVQDQIRQLGATNILLTSMKPREDEESSSRSQRSYLSIYGLLYSDRDRIDQFPGVIRTVPAKILKNREGRLGERSVNVRIVGTTPDWIDMIHRPIVAGRWLNWDDMADGDGVCVISEQVARGRGEQPGLLAATQAIGQIVRIDGNTFRVVGVIQSQSTEAGGIQAPDRVNDVYISLQVARHRFGDTNTERSQGAFSREEVQLHQLVVQVGKTDDVMPAAKAIATMLDRFHKKKDYQLDVPLALLEQAEAAQRIFSIVLASIAGISLLVGGIGIMNIMLASVTERTREIGVRRAIGAKRNQIIGQFLIETVVLSLVGGVIGLAMGLVIPWIVTAWTGMPTVVTLWSLTLSLGISAAVGMVFGLYPAYRAARVDPIVALRHE